MPLINRSLDIDRGSGVIDLSGAGVSITGAAGAAVVLNSATMHAATVRQTERQRRTIHVYYGRASQPVMVRANALVFLANVIQDAVVGGQSEHTIVPARLAENAAPEDRSLFERPNKITALMRANF